MSLVDDLLENALERAFTINSGGVFVRAMTGEERDIWELLLAKLTPDTGDSLPRAILAVMVASDETGQRLFTESTPDEISARAAIIRKQWKAAHLERLFDVGWKLNKLGEE